MRLFIAIPLPDELKQAIYNLRDEALPVRWVKPDTYHLTLKFIGDVTDQSVNIIREALCSVKVEESFEAVITQLGAFPRPECARVIWCGINPPEPVMYLEQKVTAALNEFDITGDKKPFHPHITFGRVKKSTRAVTDFIEANKEASIGRFSVDRFCLYSSELRKEGAVHTVVETYSD